MVKNLLSEKANERAKEAKENARKAEEDASGSEFDSRDYHVNKIKAEIWREVAEHYENDIEELKKKVSDMENQSAKNVEDSINEFIPEVETSSEAPALKIGNVTHRLPKP